MPKRKSLAKEIKGARAAYAKTGGVPAEDVFLKYASKPKKKKARGKP